MTLAKVEIPGSESTGGDTLLANVYFPEDPDDDTIDRIQFYYGDGDPGENAVWLTEVQLEAIIGGFGAAPGEFNGSGGVAVSGSALCVVDTGNNRVQKLDLDGEPVLCWGQAGTGNGEFAAPQGIGVDGSGNVYVSDTGNHRVQKFDAEGTHLLTFGSQGNGDGQFESPVGIACDSAGNVYVVDSGNHRVQKLTSAGVYASQWGTQGNGNDQFETPVGIAVTATSVYVTDSGNDRVQRF